MSNVIARDLVLQAARVLLLDRVFHLDRGLLDRLLALEALVRRHM